MPDTQTIVIEYGGEQISVALVFGVRKRLSITVHPDRSVTAIAPVGRPIDDVVARLHQRKSWIAKQRRHFEQFQPLPEEKRYVAGETHFYLGRSYRLRIYPSEEIVVKLIGKFLHVHVPIPKDPVVVRTALDRWYRNHAVSIFQARLHYCLTSAKSLQLSDARLRIQSMKARWGSCSKAGVITLNLALVKAPLHCIEYVIMHELCHLVVHDHSPAYYRLLDRCMPDWRRRKERLDEMVLR